MPSFIDLHSHATAGHVTSFACSLSCSRNTSDRSLAWSHHTIAKIYAIDRDRAATWNTSGKPCAVAWLHQYWQRSRFTGMWHAVGEAMAIVLKISTVIIWSWPVKCTTTKDRSRKRAVMAEGWGGRFGRSLLCLGRAERESRGSWPTTGCLPVNRIKLCPDSWRDEKGVWYRTDRQTDTHTELKRRGLPGPRRYRARDTQQE